MVNGLCLRTMTSIAGMSAGYAFLMIPWRFLLAFLMDPMRQAREASAREVHFDMRFVEPR